MVMRAAPAARRPGIRSRVYVQIRFESGAAVLAGIAWPERMGREPVREMRLLSQERSNLGVIESRMMKPRVEIHAYLGLRRLVIASVLQAAS